MSDTIITFIVGMLVAFAATIIILDRSFSGEEFTKEYNRALDRCEQNSGLYVVGFDVDTTTVKCLNGAEFILNRVYKIDTE